MHGMLRRPLRPPAATREWRRRQSDMAHRDGDTETGDSSYPWYASKPGIWLPP